MITAKCDRQIGRDLVQKPFTISPWPLCHYRNRWDSSESFSIRL